MTVEVEITSGAGGFQGHKTNISTYTYAEESTPTIPGDDSGGVGELSFSTLEADNSVWLYKSDFLFTDTFSGRVSGTLTGASTSDTQTDVRGRSVMARLNTQRVYGAVRDSLGTHIRNILDSVGIDLPIIGSFVEFSGVVMPGVEKDAWVFLKEMCSALYQEISLVDQQIFVRRPRGRYINLTNISSESWDLNEDNLAQNVEVAYYNYTNISNAVAYPKGGWNPDVQVYQVDAGQTLVIDLPVDGYVTGFLDQPIPLLFVPRDSTPVASVYTVAGNDGLPVPVAQWTDNGGNVSVAAKDNGTTIEVTITGANIPTLAPFRLAVSSGPSDFYSTLRIRALGFFFDRQVLTRPTGLTPAETSNVVGVTVDNPWISTVSDARNAAARVAMQYGMPNYTYSATARRVNRSQGSGPSIIYPTFAQWEAGQTPGDLFSDFNADFTGDSFQDFTDELFATVNNDFANQAFGNIGGALIRKNDAIFRVREAVSSENDVSITAEFDTIFADFDFEWWGSSFATFNDTWNEGKNFMNLNIRPLYRVAA